MLAAVLPRFQPNQEAFYRAKDLIYETDDYFLGPKFAHRSENPAPRTQRSRKMTPTESTATTLCQKTVLEKGALSYLNFQF